MPVTVFRSYSQSIVRDELTTTVPRNWCGVFNHIVTTSPRTMDLNSNQNLPADFEIIIRNSDSSSDAITLSITGFTADVSPDLGLIIPVGGIMQIKRLGGSSVVNVYGYIE